MGRLGGGGEGEEVVDIQARRSFSLSPVWLFLFPSLLTRAPQDSILGSARASEMYLSFFCSSWQKVIPPEADIFNISQGSQASHLLPALQFLSGKPQP